MATAIFAMGCFWKPEVVFRAVPGVLDTQVGYAGGHVENPTYRQVCGGETGHAESVRIRYDPQIIDYRGLLDVFWREHDPTTRDRQGPDIGRQYRSAIFVLDEDQQAVAEASLEAAQTRHDREIVTQIRRIDAFYRAEEYHQRYLEKAGAACF